MADKPMTEDLTATDSPSEDINSEDVSSQNDVTQNSQTGTEDETETAGAFAQKRIQRLASDKKKLLQEKEMLEQRLRFLEQNRNEQIARQLPPTPSSYPNDEVDRAVDTLKQRGFVTEEQLQQVLKQIDTRVTWDSIHSKNEAEINKRGSGLPYYDREEVEQYARERNIGDPLAAYRNLYFDEIIDAEKKRNSSSKSVTSQKPSKHTIEDNRTVTAEDFRRKLLDDPQFLKELQADPKRYDEIMRQLSQAE